jgi:predicted nucleic acid-binding protein
LIWLLDTNAFSDLMNSDPRMLEWLTALNATDRVVTCVVVRGEILFGLGKLTEGRRRTELAKQAEEVFSTIEPVPVAAAETYAEIKLGRQRTGLSLDENDLWVAATALSLGAALVSRDTDFRKVARLIIADI